MVPYNDEENNNHPQNGGNAAGGYKVEDDGNLNEKDLKKTIFGGKDANPDRPGYESHGMGGQNFGDINETRSGDDPANPSRNAGYSNDYFKRTEPAEEHPEDQNFKPQHQEGEPDMNTGKEEVPGYREAPEQQKVGGVEGDREKIQEGTVDRDGQKQKKDYDDPAANTEPYYDGMPD